MAQDQYAGKQRIGLIQQAKTVNHWGTLTNVTYGLADSNYQLLNYDKGVSVFDPDVQIDQQNFINQRGLVSESERLFTDNASGLPSMNFSGVASLTRIAPHFVAALQAVTEQAGTPFIKTITSAAKSGTIDFAGNAGFLFTIADEKIYEEAAYSDTALLRNALLDTFDFTVEPNSRGIARLAKISGTWRGGTNTILTDSTLTGTLGAMPTTGFYNDAGKFTLTLTYGGNTYTDVCFKRFTFRVENNLSSDCRGAGGVPLNFKIMPKYFIEIDLPYLDTFDYAYMQSFYKTAASEITVDFSTGTPGASGHLKLDADSGIVIQNPFGFDGEYLARPLVIELLSKTSDDQTPIEVTISDAVDWGY